MLRNVSPLRYPGGKAQLYNDFALIMRCHSLEGCSYAEPFAGGAGLALKLLDRGLVKNIILNDFDFDVWNFWKFALSESKAFCDLIQDCEVSICTFSHMRALLAETNKESSIERAFAFFFVNRTATSGIISGGPIGGKNQNGNYKLDARFNKDGLIRRFHRINELSPYIRLENLDFRQFLNQEILVLKTRPHLIYCDPPYYKQGKTLYLNAFNHRDHEELEALLAKHPNMNWCVSYDETPEINRIFNRWKSVTYNISYSANRHMNAGERMFFSAGLPLKSGRLFTG